MEAKQEVGELEGTGSPQGGAADKSPGTGRRASSKLDRTRSAAIPELKRIIVAFGNRLVMEEDLDKALNSVFGGQIFSKQAASASISQTQDISDLGVLALEYYNKAKDNLRQGRWAEYGRELENLEQVLLEISKLKQE